MEIFHRRCGSRAYFKMLATFLSPSLRVRNEAMTPSIIQMTEIESYPMGFYCRSCGNVDVEELESQCPFCGEIIPVNSMYVLNVEEIPVITCDTCRKDPGSNLKFLLGSSTSTSHRKLSDMLKSAK